MPASNSLAVGLGQVKLPAYLFDTSLAVRKGTNEIEYLPSSTLGRAPGHRLPARAGGQPRRPAAHGPHSPVRLAKDDVAAEVYVTIEQFDVDATGRGVLVGGGASSAPGGEKTLKAGESRLSRQGPAPEPDPAAPSPP